MYFIHFLTFKAEKCTIKTGLINSITPLGDNN